MKSTRKSARASRRTRPSGRASRAASAPATGKAPPPPAGPWRKLLVPLDFSTRSLEALDAAVALARELEASLVLVHVMDPAYASGQLEASRLRRLREEAIREAEQQLARVATQRVGAPVPVVQEVRQGNAYAEIVDSARRVRADLIVMGSAGRTGVNRFLLGSVAEKVVRHAPCSVLIVRS
jgi:nucleotide-binding universal stress UspA family protein